MTGRLLARFLIRNATLPLCASEEKSQGIINYKQPALCIFTQNKSITLAVPYHPIQGWIGNRAYWAFYRWANALKGPTEVFFFCHHAGTTSSQWPIVFFWSSQFKCVHRGFHGPKQIYLNKKKDKILSELMFYSYPKRLDAMIDCISTLPVKSFRTVRFLFCSPSLHLFDPKYSKSSILWNMFTI